ncbi:unnamed protein product [Mesocestoides corti]|uniref:Serrate RNA effector molecule homolog n=1 Tax=Mesocestoides corti TaxID=53468 RepID=A0A0R3U966_MESCO|nr:unnamed protein product [Mesocestoides corti]
MTLAHEKIGNQVAPSQDNVRETVDVQPIEHIQKSETTTFLQPTFAPKMMSLSKFLEPFDESALTDEDAAKKYSTYIAGFLKEQLSDQFERHKNSAWFRDKYHPDHVASKNKDKDAIIARFDVFKKMYYDGFFGNISLEYKERAAITKLLDQFAVLMAGGTSDDLAELETFDPKSLLVSNDVREKMKSSATSSTSVVQSANQTTMLSSSLENPPQEKSTKRERKSSAGRSGTTRTETSAHSSTDEDDDGNSSDSSTSSSNSSTSASTSTSSSSSVSSRSSSSSASTSSSTSSSSSHHTSRGSSHNEEDEKMSGKHKRRKKIDAKPSAVKDSDPTEVQSAEAANNEGDDAKMEVDEKKEVEVEEETSSEPVKPPIHATRVVFLPYFPLTVHRATIETLLSEHPDFLRFVCLDPTPIPAPSTALNDPLAPLALPRAATSLVLHRPAWITFAALRPRGADRASSSPPPPPPPPPPLPPPAPLDFVHQLAERLREEQGSREATDLAACLSAARLLPGPFCLERVRASSRLAATLAATSKNAALNPICSKAVMRRHLVMAAKLVGRLDEVSGLWKAPNSAESPSASDWSIPRLHELDPEGNLIGASSVLTDLSVSTANPLLENLTDHLVDESNPDEVLLYSGGGGGSPKAASPQKPVDAEDSQPADAELTRALDTLVLYLRLVYSVDFYAPALYPRESDMPHPCGLLHVRPSGAPSARLPSPPRPVFAKQPTTASAHKVFARQLCRIFRLVTPLVRQGEADEAASLPPSAPPPPQSVEGEQNNQQQQPQQQQEAAEGAHTKDSDTNGRRLRLLGYRDVDDVVEAFIKANTKRKKRKVDIIWVCPLSDKKFRGPAFVRKHILNKHMEKVEEAKKENAYFFNNFLLDPMRPELMRPPKRRLPVRKPSVDEEEEDEGSESDDEVPPRNRQAVGGLGSPFAPYAPRTRYWNTRGGGGGGYYNRGGVNSNQRRYNRPNSWAPNGGGQRRNSYYRHDGDRGNSYFDLDAP